MTARRVPGSPGRCQRCSAPIVWARTLASDTGTGGKAMPLDPLEDLAGNVATRPTSTRSAVARVLRKGETPDRTCEVLAMPHAATCQPALIEKPRPVPDGVVDLAAHRSRKQHR